MVRPTVTSGTYVYRLKQMDLTGHFAYSSEVTVPGVLGVETTKRLPKEFALQQNYPNPFNPTTSINFALPRSSYVTLAIFDLLRQEVTVLVNGELPAGYRSVTWDASNVPSGMYFYRLQAGNFIETKKLLLLK